MNVKISVVVPCYQVQEYVGNCINSILAQTFSDFEIILVDDGSKDKTSEICDEYSENYPNIAVVHKENGGLSDARNEGMKYATGEYICFIDSDDYIHPEYLNTLYELAEKHDADVAVCAFRKVYDTVCEHQSICEQNVSFYTGEQAVRELVLSDKIYDYAWNKLYKKHLFDDIKYPIGKKWEDMGATYKIFDKSDKVVYTDAELYYYLQRENSISNISSITNYFDIYDLCTERYLLLKDKYPELKNAIRTQLCSCGFGCWSLLQTEKNLSAENIKKAQELVAYLNENGKQQLSAWCGFENVKKRVQLYFSCRPMLKIMVRMKRLMQKSARRKS